MDQAHDQPGAAEATREPHRLWRTLLALPDHFCAQGPKDDRLEQPVPNAVDVGDFHNLQVILLLETTGAHVICRHRLNHLEQVAVSCTPQLALELAFVDSPVLTYLLRCLPATQASCDVDAILLAWPRLSHELDQGSTTILDWQRRHACNVIRVPYQLIRGYTEDLAKPVEMLQIGNGGVGLGKPTPHIDFVNLPTYHFRQSLGDLLIGQSPVVTQSVEVF